MASESRLRCGFGHSVATTKAMNVFCMILHSARHNLTPWAMPVSCYATLNASQRTCDAVCESAGATCISQCMLSCGPGGLCGQGAGQRLKR